MTVNESFNEGGAITNGTYSIDCTEVAAVSGTAVETTVNDTKPPTTSGHIPAKAATEVARNTIVELHVKDGGSGVDYGAGPVTISVEGTLIYDGANEDPGATPESGTYTSATGVCRRSGAADAKDYTFKYEPDDPFGYEQEVNVIVDATDLAGNAMTQETYSFTTEMRSFGENARVNSDTLSSLAKAHSATATDSEGNIWIVWDQARTGGGTDIYIGKLPADGAAFEASVQITDNTCDQIHPDIAIDGNDKMYVTWQDNSNGDWDIFTSTSTDGNTWTGAVQVNGALCHGTDQTAPAIAIDSTNQAYVVWQDGGAGFNEDIFVATSADGTTWTEAQVTDDTADQTEPAIAIDAADTAYLVWTDARTPGRTDIYGADSATGPWTNVQITNNAHNQSSPAIATESAGTVLHLLWVDDTNENADIFYDKTTGGFAAGLPLVGENIVDDDTSAAQTTPAIAVSGTGADVKVFAAWEDARNVANENGDTDIYYAESTSPFGTNILVNDDGGTYAQSDPCIAVDGRGSPYLAWTDGRDSGSDIYYVGARTVGNALATAQAQPNVAVVVEVTDSTDPGGTDGQADNTDDVRVEVPAGAVESETTLTIAKMYNPPPPPTNGFGLTWEFGPSGLQFQTAVTVAIPYDPNAESTPDVTHVYWWDSSLNAGQGGWSEEGISNVRVVVVIIGQLNEIRFETTHFSAYALGGVAGGSSVAGAVSGGGCAMSDYPRSNASILGFLMPYLALLAMWLILRLRRRPSR